MIELNDRQYRDFQEGLRWNIGTLLPDGRILGKLPEDGGIAVTADVGNDARITDLFRRTDTENKRILELGCFEAHHTVSIAALCKEVVAVEVRPANIINALVRLYVHGVSNVRIVMKDVREIDTTFGKFDILFHAGILYHLENPVEHFYRIAGIAPVLLLDTQFCYDDTQYERSDIIFNGRTYRAHLWKESGWEEPLSGLDSYSRWLHKDALIQLLQDTGYTDIEETCIIDMPVGPRIAIMAKHNSKATSPR